MTIDQALMNGIYAFFSFAGFAACLGALIMIVGVVTAVFSYSPKDEDKPK